MEYPKVETLFNRDPKDMKRVIVGDFRDPAFAVPARWMLTEKIDGTNIRLHLKEGSVKIGGRTEAAQIPAHLLDVLQRDFPPARVAGAFDPGTEAIIFGEGYGPKIQKGGGLYRPTPGFIVFDVAVLAPNRVWWLEWDAVKEVARKIGAPTVPVIDESVTVDQAVLITRGLRSSEAVERRLAEGVVARTVPGLLMRNGKRLVWKLKARDLGAEDPC